MNALPFPPWDEVRPRTYAPTGRVGRNWTESKTPSPGFMLVGELAQVPHYPETRTSLGGCLFTAPDLSGSGRVDRFTRPVAAARAAVATGAYGSIYAKHVSGTWKCGSLSFVFAHPPEDKKKHAHEG